MAVARDFRRFESSSAAAIASLDWKKIAYLMLVSRSLDVLEEGRLSQERRILYQFSARGHELAQIILGTLLDQPRDAVSGYYRSRPLMLALGLSLDDAMAGPMMRAGGLSDGRDIGVVFNMPGVEGPSVLPMCGGVGAQYTPVAGWAQSILYRRDVLGEPDYQACIGVAVGGDASVATNGFWSALNIATTQNLPMLFFVEDNQYGISVPSVVQTPDGDIAANLAAFRNLYVLNGDGTDPAQAATLIQRAVGHVRTGQGPALLRLRVPRLCGHSGQDTQAYKSERVIQEEISRDPLPKLEQFMLANFVTRDEWQALKADAAEEVERTLERVLARPEPDPAAITRYLYCETRADGQPELQTQGGVLPEGHSFPAPAYRPEPEPGRVNMVTAIRRTLDFELADNPRVVVFGEDVGAKGGVHAVTMGLQEKHGAGRVFDTSLSEEGIIGRANGMALAGLMPVPEIQFRKYADPAEEQLNDCGSMRWRTANRFAAPMVVRIAGGFFRCGDPWHSQCNEVKWVHATGWQVAMPSNAEDAVGMLRFALRDNNPTIFFEHRNLLDLAWARRPYPGDDYVVPFGRARTIREGEDLTVVTWGAMVPRCEAAAEQVGADAEVIDLRTLRPWDERAVLDSVRKTHRCLIVHEDNLTAGFGAEIAARVADVCFFDLDAPIKRLAMPDVPCPHSPVLLDAVIPGVSEIAAAITDLRRI